MIAKLTADCQDNQLAHLDDCRVYTTHVIFKANRPEKNKEPVYSRRVSGMNTISPSPSNNYQLRPAICSALIFLAVVFGGVVCMVVNSTNTKPRLEYLLLGVTCLGIGTIATSVSIICFVLKQSRVIEKIPPNKAPPPKSVPFVVDRLMARAATNLEYRACEDLLSSNTVRPSTTMQCAYKSNYHVV